MCNVNNYIIFYSTENSFCTIDNWNRYWNRKLTQTDIYRIFTHNISNFTGEVVELMRFIKQLFLGICWELPAVQENVWNSSEACDGGWWAVASSWCLQSYGRIRMWTGNCLSKWPFAVVTGLFSVRGSNKTLVLFLTRAVGSLGQSTVESALPGQFKFHG